MNIKIIFFNKLVLVLAKNYSYSFFSKGTYRIQFEVKEPIAKINYGPCNKLNSANSFKSRSTFI